MTVFFDHQAFCIQTYGGLSRYYTELIAGLSRSQMVTPLLPLLYANNRHLREAGLYRRPFAPDRPFPKREQLMTRIDRWYDTVALRTRPFDLFHATYYNPYFLPHLNRKRRTPFVVTFLDMIHERLGHQFPYLAQDRAIGQHKCLLAGRADRLIAVSESTKRDMVDLLGVDPDKIDVIYHGSSFASVMPTPLDSPDHQTAKPYLLYVGLRRGYKNFDGLLKAVHPLLEREQLSIICAGGGSFTAEEHRLIHELKLSNLVKQQPATDAELKTLYRRAFAFVFPSLYEGFGIPILEAFACDCPCVLSNRSSLPEIGGNAALYADPAEPETLPVVIEQLLSDQTLRQTLIRRGRERVARFTWQDAVDQTIRLYGSLVSGPR